MESIFNQGELEIQEKLGVRQIAEQIGKSFTNKIIKGAVPFIENQTMVIVSTTDANGRMWTSILLGVSGFIKVIEQDKLCLDLIKVLSDKEDIFYRNIQSDQHIGCLFIELSTRRRYRVNGTAKLIDTKIYLNVIEAYPNCPKYIQQRIKNKPNQIYKIPAAKKQGTMLNTSLKQWIVNADTLFVGSSGLNGRTDTSHRGGPSGFVEWMDESTLKIPDYRGNNLYNTLGNFIENPKGSLLFIDFEKNKTLQLTGTSKIKTDLNDQKELEKSGGTGRFWFFTIESWIETENHHNTEWDFVSYSKYNPKY